MLRSLATISLLVAALAAAPSHALAATTEIVVMLRDRAGRDSDLDARPLSTQEVDSLERAVAVPLSPLRLQESGAQVLGAPSGLNDPALRLLLARLRALPQVLYADQVEHAPAQATSGTWAQGAQLDRIVVKLRDRASRDASDANEPMPEDALRELIRVAGVPLYYERPLSGGAYVLRLFQRMPFATLEQIAKRLEADPKVAYAEPTARGRFQSVPDDPLFEAQWPLFDAVAGIRAPEAWEWTTGSPSVVVAVLDTGILRDHPDLRGRTLPGYDFASDVRRSNDFDGRDPNPSDPGDAAAASECAMGAPASDSTWHGTHVAGTLGAATNNGEGVAGVSWSTAILPIRVGAKCGIDPIDLTDAIRWSAGAIRPGSRIPDAPPRNDHPARVINLSIEFAGPCPRYLQDAITDAIGAGALVVVAAGNSGRPAESFYPPSCQGVVVVGATDRAGGRASYSNYGRVHLSAPGGSAESGDEGRVLSTDNRGRKAPSTNGYGYKDGTSMAAPLVSGVASLVLSINPHLTPGEVHNILEASASPFPVDTGLDCASSGPESCGAGILDAAAAVAATQLKGAR